MKLTKLQRHTAYIILLHEIEVSVLLGICPIFSYMSGIELDDDGLFTKFKTMLPELWNKRRCGRNECYAFLWETDAERISALKQCIEETY